MVNHLNKALSALGCFIVSSLVTSTVSAGEWRFTPSLGLTETYTNNVELTSIDKTSSVVGQFILGADARYSSKNLQFSFNGTETLARYSHNSELNDDYQTLQANTTYDLWSDNLQAIASSSISNVSTSDTGNSLADLVSADTVQQENHSIGLQFNSGNSFYSVNSSLIYDTTQTEDGIGESDGQTFVINSKNGTAARTTFWDLDGSFQNQENNGFNGENYRLEGKLGAITSYKLNPFIRIYNEKVTGNLAGSNADAIPSWGPGVRYQAAKHFIIDLSYNYIRDNNQASDDYIAADIDWQPSARTSLQASYSKRFFGDSYEVDLTHSTRRLTNTLSYHNTIEAFDRNNYQESANGESELEENNEFSLNKRLEFQSVLSLARTTFSLNLSARERETLESNIVDDYLTARISTTRRISGRSKLTVFFDYSKNTFDKENPAGARQLDYYKTYSATYDKSLASSLNGFLTIQYIDRQSNIERYDYKEARASINLTKDF